MMKKLSSKGTGTEPFFTTETCQSQKNDVTAGETNTLKSSMDQVSAIECNPSKPPIDEYHACNTNLPQCPTDDHPSSTTNTPNPTIEEVPVGKLNFPKSPRNENPSGGCPGISENLVDESIMGIKIICETKTNDAKAPDKNNDDSESKNVTLFENTSLPMGHYKEVPKDPPYKRKTTKRKVNHFVKVMPHPRKVSFVCC